MAYRELEMILLSARDLKNVNLFMRMEVYAVASISGDPTTRQRTRTDTFRGRDPSWDATLHFSVPPTSKAAGSSGWLHVLLRCERLLGDRDVGEVVVPLAELLRAGGADDGMGPQGPRTVWYQVHTVERAEPRGVLNVSYRLGPVVAPVADDKPPVVIGQPVLAPQKHFPPQNPVHPYHHPPHDSYASSGFWGLEGGGDQNPGPTQQSIKLKNPPPPLPLSPANGHGTKTEKVTQVTQVFFATPPSNTTIPAKPPKPSYTPTHQPITSSVKTDHSWPKASPQHHDHNTPTWPNDSPHKTDLSTRPQLTPEKTTTDRSARPQGPKQAYANIGSNNMTGGKADNHMSGSKVVLPIESIPSMPTATAR